MSEAKENVVGLPGMQQAPQIQPEQALQNLDSAVSQIQANRDVHAALQESIRSLGDVVNEWRQSKK